MNMFSGPNPFASFQNQFQIQAQDILKDSAPGDQSQPSNPPTTQQPIQIPNLFPSSIMPPPGVIPQIQPRMMDTSPNKSQAEQPISGEIIPSRYYIYHSIGDIASQINEQQALQDNRAFLMCFYRSIASQSSKVKSFKYKNQSIVVLMQGENDLQLLINQEDHIQSLLTPYHKEGRFTGPIMDFTLIRNDMLYLLYPTSLIILDIASLVNTKNASLYHHDDAKPVFIDQISLLDSPIQAPFYKVESLPEKDDILLLLYKGRASVAQLNLNSREYNLYSIDNDESRLIRDIDIYNQYVSILYDKNEVIVYDTRTGNKVFRSTFKDATQQISRLFYVSDLDETSKEAAEGEDDEDYNRFKYDEIVGDDDEFSTPKPQANQMTSEFKGHFLFVENQVTKQVARQSSLQSSGTKSKQESFFEKLCLVKVINNMNAQMLLSKPVTQPLAKKSKNDQQDFHQEGFLKITERTVKLVEYDRERGVIFLLNKERPSQNLKLYSVKLKKIEHSDSDSDNGGRSGIIDANSRFKFSLIKEMRLQLNFSVQQAINNSVNDQKKPRFIKVIKRIGDEEMFCCYIAIGGQILAYQLPVQELTNDEHLLKDTNLKSTDLMGLNTGSLFSNPIFDPDFMNKLKDNETMIKSEPHLLEEGGESPPFGIITNPDQNLEARQKRRNQKKELASMAAISKVEKPIIEEQNPENQLDPSAQSILDQIFKMGQPIDEDEKELPTEDKDIVEQYDLKEEKKQVEQELNRAIEDTLRMDEQYQFMQVPVIDEIDDSIIVKKQPISQSKLEEEKVPIANDLIDAQEQKNIESEYDTGKRLPLDADFQRALKESLEMAQKQNIIPQQQQPVTQQLPPATSSKKKKNKKNKANLNTQPSESKLAPIPEKPKEIIQPTAIKSSANIITQIPPTQPIIQQQQQIIPQPSVAQLMTNANNMMASLPKKNRSQQDLLIENFSVLVQKYADLEKKFTQVQQQLQNQQNQQIDLDKAIQSNIQLCMPPILEQQLKETVIPMVIQHMKGIDRSVKEEIMPRVEQQVETLITRLIDNGQLRGNQAVQGEIKTQLNDQKIRQMIVSQFSSAMENTIKPMLEDQFKQMIEGVQLGLSYVNQEFTGKLRQEEEKNKNLMTYYMEKLDHIIEQQQNLSQQNISFVQQHQVTAPPAGHYYPPPPYGPYPPGGYMGHPYPPYPHYPPPTGYPPAYPQSSSKESAAAKKSTQIQQSTPAAGNHHSSAYGQHQPTNNILMDRTQSYNPSFNPVFSQSMFPGASQLNKSFLDQKISSRLIDLSEDENELVAPHGTGNLDNPIASNNLLDHDNNGGEDFENTLTKAGQVTLNENMYIGMSRAGGNGRVSQMVAANGMPLLMYNDNEDMATQAADRLRMSQKVMQQNNLALSQAKSISNAQMQIKQIQMNQKLSLMPSASDPIAYNTMLSLDSKGQEKGSKQNQFEPVNFIKMAARGHLNQIDKLFTNKDFTQQMLEFLKFKTEQLDQIQNPLFIFQFMEKLYQKTKTLPGALKEGTQIFRLILNKYCKNNANFAGLIERMTDMEKNLKQLQMSQNEQ